MRPFIFIPKWLEIIIKVIDKLMGILERGW